ncbi:ccr4 [Symbiodinium sp. CCMP2456]|nr:ccr4 [Symbiodinium sp. CCMP2456]
MRFSVLSYNVLHSAAAKRLRSRQSPPAQGFWADRLQRAAELVSRLAPDIACLQEFDPAAKETFERYLQGYRCAVILQNEDLPPKDGCAIFLRSDLVVTKTHSFRIRDAVERHFPASLDIRGTAGLAAALWRELHEKLSVAVAVEIADETSGRKLCISTSHLYWDPRYPDLKLLQAFLLARELETVAATELILAGDLNSTPLADGRSSGEGDLSGVYELLVTGRVSALHPHHPVRMRPGSGILRGVGTKDVPDLRVSPFHSAYKEALGCEQAVTNLTKDFQGCLDYILYRGTGLQLRGVRPLPEQLPEQLPSEEHPSDHLPLYADFELE